MPSGNQTNIEEEKVDLNGTFINYVKVGDGPHVIICLPGAIGSWVTDFKEVLEKYDRSKFTIVCWDPPGFGKSRPPDRDFSLGYNKRDAILAHSLMEKSIPENIKKMVIWGASSYVTQKQVDTYELKDVSKWNEASRKQYVDLYGMDYFQWAWAKHFEARTNIFKLRGGNKCKDILPEIPQPVLVVHGTADIFVPKEHPEYFDAVLPNSKVVYVERGRHDVHKQSFSWFRDVVEEFITT